MSQISILESFSQEAPVPQLIPLNLVTSHPARPRLGIRQDVVDAIASRLKQEGFKPQYAIYVRPYKGGYQIIQGHQRRLAAIQAGFTEILAWIEEMDDETALMELIAANRQGELSPLEIGLGVLKQLWSKKSK